MLQFGTVLFNDRPITEGEEGASGKSGGEGGPAESAAGAASSNASLGLGSLRKR